jgi:putative NADH-flavin reductase
MKIAVVGATGQTGRQITRIALDRGMTVIALVRDPAKISERDERLRVEVADISDPDAMTRAMSGCDAVVSALGATTPREPTSVCERGVATVLTAMSRTGIDRLIVLSNSVHTPALGDSILRRLFIRVIGRVLRHPCDDLRGMEERLRASRVSWTAVRAPRLTNGPHTGRYRTVAGGHVRGGWRISRADVADAIVTMLADPSAARGGVGAAY